MKPYRMFVVAIIAVFLLGLCTQTQCADSVGQQVTVKGKVEVIKDPSGLITSVKIIAQDSTYFVTLDDSGNALGAQKNGAYVVVVGMLSVKDNQQWLTVLRYSEQQASN